MVSDSKKDSTSELETAWRLSGLAQGLGMFLGGGTLIAVAHFMGIGPASTPASPDISGSSQTRTVQTPDEKAVESENNKKIQELADTLPCLALPASMRGTCITVVEAKIPPAGLPAKTQASDQVPHR